MTTKEVFQRDSDSCNALAPDTATNIACNGPHQVVINHELMKTESLIVAKCSPKSHNVDSSTVYCLTGGFKHKFLYDDVSWRYSKDRPVSSKGQNPTEYNYYEKQSSSHSLAHVCAAHNETESAVI